MRLDKQDGNSDRGRWTFKSWWQNVSYDVSWKNITAWNLKNDDWANLVIWTNRIKHKYVYVYVFNWGLRLAYYYSYSQASFSNLSQLITTNCSSLYYLSLPFLFPSEDCPLGTWWGPPSGPRLGPREGFRTIDWQVGLMQIAPSWLLALCWCWAGMPVFNFLTWPLRLGSVSLRKPPSACLPLFSLIYV